MITVIATVGRQIEGDRDPHLPRRQPLAVKGVALLGGREPGILPDRPGPSGIHGGAWPTGIRGLTGQCAEMIEPRQIVLCV